MAQHEVVELTTYITNLRLTNSWKGMTPQFLTHFKQKLSHAPFSSNKQLSPFLISDRFTSWTLFGIKILVLLSHSATKPIMTCSRVPCTVTISWSTQLYSATEPTPTLNMRMMILASDPLILNPTTLRTISIVIKPTSPIFQASCLATHPRFFSLGPFGMNLQQG